MKYILMMTANKSEWESFGRWSKEDLAANIAFMRDFTKQLKEEGVFVATEGLGWPQQAKIVRAGANGTPITDGVFPESKEFLAGYWIIDVENPDHAYKIAARVSAAPGPGGKPGSIPIEVRPVLSGFSDMGL
ncbi:MAG TPA: YciI family protein [Candidatus Acidoferrum sp.]|nr:YciI family protein [Candidatus Acidoferrum sp.]